MTNNAIKAPRALSWAEIPKEVLDLGRKLSTERDLPTLFQVLTREAARLLNADSASVLLFDPERSELWAQSTVDGAEIRFDSRLGIAGAALTTGEVINVKDAQHDERFYSTVDSKTKKRTRTVLAVPLRTPEGQPIGVFEAINKRGGAFTAHDERCAIALASQVAVPLQTANLVKELQARRRQLEDENANLWKEVESRFSTQRIIGNSPRMQNIVRLIDQIRDSSVDVLITGENGTGKEMIAKAIHFNSPRAKKPFVPLNSASLPDNLVESELFGIEKGVATTVDARIGKFEQANGGTLFLDEIGDLGLQAQAKILRVLSERIVEHVGGRTGIPIDVRIIAATNKNLEAAIKNGEFREDLYYRLNVIRIQTPALREIPEDIPLLANYFLNKYCQEMGKEAKKFSTPAMRSLQSYTWPGNIRQLEKEIMRLVVMVRRTTISEEDLDEAIQARNHQTRSSDLGLVRSLPQAVEELEQRMIQEALLACHGNQVQSAKRLGISRQGLIKKMKRYGMSSSP